MWISCIFPVFSVASSPRLRKDGLVLPGSKLWLTVMKGLYLFVVLFNLFTLIHMLPQLGLVFFPKLGTQSLIVFRIVYHHELPAILRRFVRYRMVP